MSPGELVLLSRSGLSEASHFHQQESIASTFNRFHNYQMQMSLGNCMLNRFWNLSQPGAAVLALRRRHQPMFLNRGGEKQRASCQPRNACDQHRHIQDFFFPPAHFKFRLGWRRTGARVYLAKEIWSVLSWCNSLTFPKWSCGIAREMISRIFLLLKSYWNVSLRLLQSFFSGWLEDVQRKKSELMGHGGV